LYVSWARASGPADPATDHQDSAELAWPGQLGLLLRSSAAWSDAGSAPDTEIRVDARQTGSVAKDNRVVNNSWIYGSVSSAGPTSGTNCPWITWSGNTLVTIDSS
jgi:hypothetical protein